MEICTLCLAQNALMFPSKVTIIPVLPWATVSFWFCCWKELCCSLLSLGFALADGAYLDTLMFVQIDSCSLLKHPSPFLTNGDL